MIPRAVQPWQRCSLRMVLTAPKIRARVLSVAAILAAGCSQPIAVAREDASLVGDAGRSDGSTIGGGDGEAGSDAGGGDASAPPDSGDGVAPLTWGRMVLPPRTDIVLALWGRSASDIYAGTQNGEVLHFEPVNGWQVAWREPSGQPIRGIFGGSNIYVAADQALYVHAGQLNPNPTRYPLNGMVSDLRGKSDTEIYLATPRNMSSALEHFDGMAVSELIQVSGANFVSLAIAHDGTLFVGASGGISSYRTATLFPEMIVWPPEFSPADQAAFDFNAILDIGGRAFAVGTRYWIFERDPMGRWRQSSLGSSDGDLYGIAGNDLGGGEIELYAVGNGITGGPLRRFHRGTWRTDALSDVQLATLWTAGPNEYYAGGTESQPTAGVILRGVR
jgi:hypothetical protein